MYHIIVGQKGNIWEANTSGKTKYLSETHPPIDHAGKKYFRRWVKNKNKLHARIVNSSLLLI